MTSTTAHIITADAVALGAPAILIFKGDGVGAARIVWQRDLAATANGADAQHVLADHSPWRPVGDRVEVAAGYYVVTVEPVPAIGCEGCGAGPAEPCETFCMSYEEQAEQAECVCDGGHPWPFGGTTPHRDQCPAATR